MDVEGRIVVGLRQWQWRQKSVETTYKDLDKGVPLRQKRIRTTEVLSLCLHFHDTQTTVLLETLAIQDPGPAPCFAGLHSGHRRLCLPLEEKTDGSLETRPPGLRSRNVGSRRLSSKDPEFPQGLCMPQAHCQDLNGLLPQIWPPVSVPLGEIVLGDMDRLWGVQAGRFTYVQTEHSGESG